MRTKWRNIAIVEEALLHATFNEDSWRKFYVTGIARETHEGFTKHIGDRDWGL